MGRGLLIGWKAIAGVFDMSADHVRKNWKKWKLPVKHLPNGKPAAIQDDIEDWLRREDWR